MCQFAILSVLAHVLLLSSGTLCLKPEEGAGLLSGAGDLPWQDQLCYDSPSAQERKGGATPPPERNRSTSNLPQHPRCYFRSVSLGSSPNQASGTCLNMLCKVDDNWENLSCDLGVPKLPSGRLNSAFVTVSLQRLMPLQNNKKINHTSMESSGSLVCETLDSCMRSIPIGPANFVAIVKVNISDCEAGPVLLNVPARPVKPRSPLNLSHFQTIKPELILQWNEPKDYTSGALRYEVRYSNDIHPSWQVVSTGLDRRLILDLRPEVNYTVQVRCSGLHEPPLWSNWSQPYHIYLSMVSYIPEEVLAQPGENVSVYCVFNDHSIDANSAVWVLNFQQRLPPSQYHSVNQKVSHITVQPSDSGMYDLLQCRAPKLWNISYSTIYIEEASVDIACKTSGDIDALKCRWWKNTPWFNQPQKPTFHFLWADLPCEEMEEREKKGEKVGEMGPKCVPVLESEEQVCTIKPIRMNCYKLWLEGLSHRGPFRSKPVYVSPIDHVKPHPPTNVTAANLIGGVLRITWEPPSFPVQGVQCQLRLGSPTSRAQPEWKIYNPVSVPWVEVPIPDTIQVYRVQVRCVPTNLTGYWSDWSVLKYSVPQNRGATTGDPTAYTTMLVIILLSIVLFITVVLSQNQMKRFVWKDVPNPKKCSWAKGLNFKKADAFQELFQASDVLPAWPLLLPSENISKVVIMEKANLSVLGTALVRSPLMSPTPDIVSLPAFLEGNQNMLVGGEALLGDIPPSVLDLDILTAPRPRLDELQLVDASPSIIENSAQSSVTYATVLLSDPKQQQQSVHLHARDGSGSSSSDEGNFSANYSDISGSFPGGLWELESCHGGETGDPRRSCSYNSVEELSETSDQEDAAGEKDLYYLGVDYQGEDEAQRKEERLKSVILNRDDCSADSHLPPTELLPASTCVLSPLYMPQFRTAPYTRQLPD